MLKNIQQKLKSPLIKKFFFILFLLASIVVVVLGGINIYFFEKIYPNTIVAGVNIGGLDINKAALKIQNNTTLPVKISINGQGQNFEIQSQTIEAEYDSTKTAERAYNLYRTGNILNDTLNQFASFFRKKEIGISTKFNEQKLNNVIQDISGNVFIEPVYPSVALMGTDIQINPGQAGVDVDKNLFRALVGASYSQNLNQPISIPTKIIDPRLTDDESKKLRIRAEKLFSKNLTFVFEFKNFQISSKEILGFLSKEGYSDEKISNKITDISRNIDREAVDSKFVFVNGENKVKEFAPSQDGIKTDTQKLRSVIIESLQKLESGDVSSLSMEVPVIRTSPKITTSEVNNLGIKELIGRGSSKFVGSIPSRVHNVGHASQEVNGTMVPPGETLSFNEAVGDVSVLTGYQQAYVIKDGKTVLGDGGGLCQVSTTLFRAALNAGLPVIERRAHSYRVGYYEQDLGPGIDATVYSPTTDLKIKNDTPGYILIQTYFDAKTYSLVFEIYGTNDGRIAKTTKPVVTNVTTPPEDLYQDDPTLPNGVVKQVEHRANGAKVTFNYTVERNGQKIYEKSFVSNYRPWQAVYLRGTAPTN